jgi:hypothetical protein
MLSRATYLSQRRDLEAQAQGPGVVPPDRTDSGADRGLG